MDIFIVIEGQQNKRDDLHRSRCDLALANEGFMRVDIVNIYANRYLVTVNNERRGTIVDDVEELKVLLRKHANGGIIYVAYATDAVNRVLVEMGGYIALNNMDDMLVLAKKLVYVRQKKIRASKCITYEDAKAKL